jgi:hypothetical protein
MFAPDLEGDGMTKEEFRALLGGQSQTEDL